MNFEKAPEAWAARATEALKGRESMIDEGNLNERTCWLDLNTN